MIEEEGIPQTPGPHQGEPPRSERDPRHPTATAPDSVEEVLGEDTGSAGEAVPGADLNPDESADVMETREEAHRIKQTRDDLQDESPITLDPGD